MCEDPELIGAWFRLVQNMRAKYGIMDYDFYNFDETGFIIGVICASMVVTRADRRSRDKAVQLGIGNKLQRLPILMAKVGTSLRF